MNTQKKSHISEVNLLQDPIKNDFEYFVILTRMLEHMGSNLACCITVGKLFNHSDLHLPASDYGSKIFDRVALRIPWYHVNKCLAQCLENGRG